MNSVIKLPDIASAIKESFPEIPFAHIFGSSIKGIIKQGSDIDIAIWYNGTDPLLKVKVVETIQPFLKNIPIDIINFYNADPILAHEALAGDILFVREEQKLNYASYYTKVLAEYEDRMYWIKKQLQYRGYEVQWSH